MFQTIIVYILIYGNSLLCANRAKIISLYRNTSLDSTNIFYVGLVIFATIVGLRWNVGIDYPAYYDLLTGNNLEDIQLGRLELIPRLSIEYIKEHGIPFYVWFIIMAFLQMFFLLKTFGKDLKVFVVWGVFFYLTGQLALAMNIIRQATAVTIVLYAYSFLYQNKYIKYLIWIVIASLFHTSALIGIPVMLVSKIKISFNKVLQIFIITSFFILGEKILNYVIDMLANYSGGFTYLLKVQTINNDDFAIEKGSGLGVIFYYARYLVLILYSKKMSTVFGRYGFDLFYTLSFIGMCFYKATMYNMILSRVMMYFTISSIVCLSMLMFYLYKNSKRQINLLLLIGLTFSEIFITIYTIVKGEPWMFIWDSVTN